MSDLIAYNFLFRVIWLRCVCSTTYSSNLDRIRKSHNHHDRQRWARSPICWQCPTTL